MDRTPQSSAFCFLIVGALVFVSSGAYGEVNEQKVRTCKKIENQIDTYTRLRKSGGTAKQMDKWHRKRNNLKQRFSQLHCKY